MEKMGRDRKREPAAVDETGKRERVVVRSWQGCQMSTLGLCQVVIEFFRSPVNLESLFPFKTRSMERKRRRMELRASPGKILPLW